MYIIKNPAISVVVSTYNSPTWLDKTLCSLQQQTFREFEIIIADDGSGQETTKVVERYKKNLPQEIIHVWHPDDGFQKSKILNKALEQCNAAYVVMTDGDCLAREDFLQIHFERKEKGHFLSGGYFKLPMKLSEQITLDDIRTQKCFEVDWLAQRGVSKNLKTKKLDSGFVTGRVLEKITTTNATWNGHNSSGWLEDILAVNGFDERMQYGGQDRELGERLLNYGIKGKQIRYSAICLHLDHSRGYKNEASIKKNQAIRKHTRSNKVKRTPYGIVKEDKA